MFLPEKTENVKWWITKSGIFRGMFDEMNVKRILTSNNSSGAFRLLWFEPLPFLPLVSAFFLILAELAELELDDEGSKRAEIWTKMLKLNTLCTQCFNSKIVLCFGDNFTDMLFQRVVCKIEQNVWQDKNS